jgi:hypothetical protein
MASSLLLGSGVLAAASASRKQPVHAQCALSGGLAGSSCGKVTVICITLLAQYLTEVAGGMCSWITPFSWSEGHAR